MILINNNFLKIISLIIVGFFISNLLNIFYLIFLIWVFAIYYFFFEKYYNILIYTIIQSFSFFLLASSTFIFLYKNLLENQNHHLIISTNNQYFLADYIQLVFFLDFFSGNFIALTAILASIILLYSLNYMKDDQNITSFVSFIVFFAISMITLLCAGNFFTCILGWELIGLTSFFLINFWSLRSGTLKSALKAFFFNKFSDSALYIFFIFLLINNNTFLVTNPNIYLTTNTTNSSSIPYMFLLLSAFCKSVQFGFHIWLPDSMEAPIPASSLIHSATLVSAGVYIATRYSFEIQYLFPTLSLLSSFTAAYGSIIASSQNDLKKILAYSTISHCGYLFFLVYSNNLLLQLVYLHLHGFFKAISFVLVGFILQSTTIYQDYRYFSYQNNNSYEFFVLPLILLNLAGLPFVVGFYSKFLFLQVLDYYWVGVLNILFIKIGAFSSIIYSLQIPFNVFYSKFRSSKLVLQKNSTPKNFNFIFLIISILSFLFFNFICYVILKNTTININYPHYSLPLLLFFYKFFFLTFLTFYKNIHWNTIYFYTFVLIYVIF